MTPWDFGQDLLPNDLDRIAPSLEVGFEHFPAIGRAGIKRVINGPFTFAPDGNPLIGPIRGLRNFWVACGVMAGFSQGGGVGLSLANWMTQGDPGADIWGMDVARFGDFATLAYTNAKVRENYSRRFRIRFPNEELEAARPLRTTPIYETLKAQNAVFGENWGLEHALWFAPKGTEPKEEITFKRSNAHPHVGRRGEGGARRRRPHRDLELRQVRGDGTGRRGLPVARHGEQGAGGRPAGAHPHAERTRQADRRLHHVPPGEGTLLPHRHLRGRELLPPLVRAASAANAA